jgi:malto-oligosyltrehalose trehalohydrolase
MSPAGGGYFTCAVPEAAPGTRYLVRRDDDPPLPDPASRFQPDGVLGPSEIVDLSAYPWTDQAWRGHAPGDLVIYELHVGTFSPEGTYEGLRRRLDHLVELGVTAVELMPLAAFSGRHNWGYDGVFHFAPFCGYGRPGELQALVDACHARGLAVILDLVTNHFGPEGNAMWSMAPSFFRPDRPTAWSAGLNWDADPVLRYFDEAVTLWIRDYHLDGLRLDAFHAVPAGHRHRHLRSMIAAIEGVLPTHRRAFVLLESVDNQTSLLRCGTERVHVAQLNFDHQRATHALLTGELQREYADYAESSRELGRCLARGFAFVGRYSGYHQRVRGEAGAPPASWDQVVNFIQNHDTCGNRYLGQRLDELVQSDALLRAATALLLLHPAIPFLFMGQEWGARSRYHFFTDLPQELGEVTQAGRLKLFLETDPATCPERAPGCQDPAAFACSRLDWAELDDPRHRGQLAFTRELLELRRRIVTEASRSVEGTTVRRVGALFEVQIDAPVPGGPSLLLIANLECTAEALPEDRGELLFSTRPCDGTSLPPATTALFRSGRRLGSIEESSLT